MRKVLVVYKKSLFELYSASPDAAVQAFMGRRSPEVEFLAASHRKQQQTLDTVMRGLERAGFEAEALYRGDLEPAAGRDLVISVGGDGTFLAVAHFVRGIPMLGVNSDPASSVGHFTAGTEENFAAVIQNLAQVPRTNLHRLEVVVDGRPLPQPALNDILFAHANPAAVSRYRLEHDGVTTEHKTSGLLVSTAAGSTGWMYQEGGEIMRLDDRRLQFLARGRRDRQPAFADRLRLASMTRQAHLFIDGPHVAHAVDLGSDVVIGGGPPLTVIGDLEAKRG